MKQAKLILLTTVVTLSAFTALVISSCKKPDACSSVLCQNGGTCSGGKCSCPTGYTGTFCEQQNQSSVMYVNNTFTPVIITINDTKSKLAVGSSISYSGIAGAQLTVNATTAVITTAGKTIGEIFTWAFIDTMPNGAFTHTLNVDPSYFYLKIANGDNYDSIIAINVNYGTPNETTDSVMLPNDGIPYVIGYYKAMSGTQVHVVGKGQGLTGSSWILTPSIPNVVNATATVSVP